MLSIHNCSNGLYCQQNKNKNILKHGGRTSNKTHPCILLIWLFYDAARDKLVHVFVYIFIECIREYIHTCIN